VADRQRGGNRVAKKPRRAAPKELATKSRHEEIVDASARIFHEKGYDAASIQDVGEAVGILKGSLYYYIDSKEDLLFEIIETPHRSMLESLERARKSEGAAMSRIRDFVVQNVEANTRDHIRAAVFHRDFRSLSGKHREAIITARDEYEGFLRELLEDGQVEGSVCADLDPTITTAAILSMTNGIYTWFRPSGQRSGPEIAQIFADLAVHAIWCDVAQHTPGHRAPSPS
jgi:AcrR family transcriptional regulator